jgi:hypothetical protein
VQERIWDREGKRTDKSIMDEEGNKCASGLGVRNSDVFFFCAFFEDFLGFFLGFCSFSFLLLV